LLLKATLTNVGEWKAILNAIAGMVEEAMFIVNDDGITFRGMDPSHVSLLDVTFPKTSFDELISQTSFFGLVVDDLKTILNMAGNDDTVEFMIENEGFMKISIKGSLEMEYNLKLLQKQEVNTPIPKTKHNVQLLMESNTLSRIISNIQHISEYIEIRCTQEGVEFEGNGFIGSAKINLNKGSPELKEIILEENSSSVYSLENMARVVRDIGKASKIVKMEYASQKLMQLHFQLPSLARVEYYLAPRVEN